MTHIKNTFSHSNSIFRIIVLKNFFISRDFLNVDTADLMGIAICLFFKIPL